MTGDQKVGSADRDNGGEAGTTAPEVNVSEEELK